MINLARDLKPDVLVVAGDVFHQRRPDEEALALFHDTLNRFLNLEMAIIFLAGPSDDFKHLHLDGRWVRDAGIYLFDDSTQVLSPVHFRGHRENFDVNVWCMPFPRPADNPGGAKHPALFQHDLVEKVVQRLNPSEVNVLFGYAWAQGGGRRAEFGHLIEPGGRPLESRLLDFFDVSALGASHAPIALSSSAHYSGSLLCYEPEDEEQHRSVILYDILGKGQANLDTYSLRPRRHLRVIEGSWEELIEKGRQVRNDDLIVLRSEEKDLSAEQRAELRIVGPNVVSVELPSPFHKDERESEEEVSELVASFSRFCQRQTGESLSEEELAVLVELERRL